MNTLHNLPHSAQRRTLLRQLACVSLLTAALPHTAMSQITATSQPPFTPLKPVGNSTLRFLGLKVYDAKLFAAPTFEAVRYGQHPLALELTYARKLEGKLIAERSLIEMRRIEVPTEAQTKRWMELMLKAFPDVAAQDRLAGVHDGNGKVRFYLNDVLRAQIDDPLFAKLFFGIWLHPNTSQPALRTELLGRAA